MDKTVNNMDKSIFRIGEKCMNRTFDIVFREDLLQIFASVSEAFEMRMALLDRDLNEIAPYRFQPVCYYCSMVQNDLGLIARCRENDARYCSAAAKEGRAVTYTCHAGLREAVFPLIIEGDVTGFFIVGQSRTSGSPPRTLLAGLKTSREREGLERAFSRVPVTDPRKLKSILKLIEITTSYAIDKKIVSLRHNLLSDRLRAYLLEDLTVNPTAEEAARAMNMSLSSVNKAMNLTGGTGFRRFSNRLRLEAAAEMLKGDRDLPVNRAAAAVGIADPLYFSRLFKREFGLSPREYQRGR